MSRVIPLRGIRWVSEGYGFWRGDFAHGYFSVDRTTRGPWIALVHLVAREVTKSYLVGVFAEDEGAKKACGLWSPK